MKKVTLKVILIVLLIIVVLLIWNKVFNSIMDSVETTIRGQVSREIKTACSVNAILLTRDGKHICIIVELPSNAHLRVNEGGR